MKILLIHAERFEYEARLKALGDAEELNEENQRGSFSNVLVCFTTVEKVDETRPEWVVDKASEEIALIAGKVKASGIVIYPYAHLSPELAQPSTAVKLLRGLAEAVRLKGLNVARAPFGWYKRFTISCLGHPLAELSRVIRPVEKTVDYAVMTPDGEVYSMDEFDLSSAPPDFQILVRKEVYGEDGAGGRPRYLDYCRKFGIEWEPFSDQGHMRYGPEATLMLELLSEYSWACSLALGIPLFKVKGTNMFSLDVEAVKQHAELYGDRLYMLDVDDRKMVLRYAACHQQFAMVRDWSISYRNLPFGVFEVADSYRLEQPGELTLCFRLRKFYMPDLHVFTRDLEEAKKITLAIHEKIYEEIRRIGRDYVSIYNLTRSFLEENRDYVERLVKMEGKPVLLHFVPENKYYWVINVEYNIIDQLGRPREIGTFQIDVGNAKRFGITFVDEHNEKRHPVIIHTALIGSLERYLYALFDTAAQAEARGEKPSLPTWICPVQARIIPVTRDQLPLALEIAETLNRRGIRVDVDDREESLAKRIREAEVKWIPYIAVIGAREAASGKLNVRMRRGGATLLTVEELCDMIEAELEGYPRLGLSLPIKVSERPGYR